jgi:CTD kinase subunit gamma
MADPFEVRMRFTSQLQHLSASSSSATKAANYALRHSEYADDLHSCILEQLERNNMNLRANIMYFLPALCDAAKVNSSVSDSAIYVRMVERDILRIIDLVAPDDGSGAANVKVVRKVLQALQGRGVLQGQTVQELEECIAGRDSVPGAPSSPAHDSLQTQQHLGGVNTAKNTPHSTARDPTTAGTISSGIRLDKRQIEQRIEEDRERHKRAREGIWAVPQQSNDLSQDAEFERLWDAASDADSDDYRMSKEEAEERRKHLEYDDY